MTDFIGGNLRASYHLLSETICNFESIIVLFTIGLLGLSQLHWGPTAHGVLLGVLSFCDSNVYHPNRLLLHCFKIVGCDPLLGHGKRFTGKGESE
jgi:hypothetical protein